MATIKEQQKVVTAFRDQFRSRPPLTVSETQKLFPQAAPVRGPVWIAQDVLHVASEDNVRNAVFDVIQYAATEKIVLPDRSEIDACDVQVEWIGQRRGVDPDARQPREMADVDAFRKLEHDFEHDTTILFAHGGAFYGCHHVTVRPLTTKLARLIKGRIVSVDYRLSPQTQFPGALLDLMLAYLALLYPPYGSKHQPVSSKNIVLAGESSGGALCLSLVQLILHMRRLQRNASPRVRFNGREVEVPMLAGVALLGPEADRTISLPSTKTNAHIDYLQALPLPSTPLQPPDHLWPSSPPRHDVYCHSSAYLHPISNPCTASDWTGSPPLWFAYGEERCLDGGKMLTSTAATQGVPVQFTEYRGMPHIFPMMMSSFKQSKDCMLEWAAVCRAMADGVAIESRARVVLSTQTPADTVQSGDVKEIFSLSRDEAMTIIRRATGAKSLYTGEGHARAAL